MEPAGKEVKQRGRKSPVANYVLLFSIVIVAPTIFSCPIFCSDGTRFHPSTLTKVHSWGKSGVKMNPAPLK